MRLGQDSPILSSASLKCSAVSRAVPSSRSCSCGCCRISSDTLLSIGAMPSHTHSARGLRQRGHSAVRIGRGRRRRPGGSLFAHRGRIRPDLGSDNAGLRDLSSGRTIRQCGHPESDR